LPRARLQVVADCGHMVNQEYPDIFNTVLLQHLRAASEPREAGRSPA
jgi:pimeloyl-ACP methyl ester carboxylesterase